jgi:hypothetical protein
MTNKKNYTLEYYISKNKFPEKITLENYVKQALKKFAEDISFEVKDGDGTYLVLSISATSKIIDACHDKLNVERNWAFRSKDELGDFIRKSAYPILSDIEITVRNFINQIMSDVLGFNWWSLFAPEDIRKKVEMIESKSGKFNIEFQHQIEFTLFDDLLKIITEKYQAWPDNHIVTTSELVDLLSNSTTIEEVLAKLESKRKVMSFWDDVFSNYFDDKKTWTQIRNKIEDSVIPIRNKVMHHRLIREHELRKLKEIRREIIDVIGSAKSQLSNYELKETSINAVTIFERIQISIPDQSEIMKNIARQMADVKIAIPIPDYSEAMRNVAKQLTDLQMTIPVLDYSEAMRSIVGQIADLKVTLPIPDYSEAVRNIAKQIVDLRAITASVPNYSQAIRSSTKQVTDLQVTIPERSKKLKTKNVNKDRNQ